MVKFHVSNVNEIPLGEAKCFTVDEQKVLIINQEGKFFCIENNCPHANRELADGFVERGCIVCPVHGAEFDLETGKSSFMMPLPKLRTYPVILEGEKLLIDI